MKTQIELVAIILLLLLYIISGIGKIFNYNDTVESVYQKKIFNVFPRIISELSIIISILLLTFGSGIIIYSKLNKQNKMIQELAYIMIICIICFTIMATILFHYPDNKEQSIHFLKNLSIIGGLTSYLV